MPCFVHVAGAHRRVTCPVVSTWQVRTDAEIDDYIRGSIHSANALTSSCRMGADGDPLAVRAVVVVVYTWRAGVRVCEGEWGRDVRRTRSCDAPAMTSHRCHLHAAPHSRGALFDTWQVLDSELRFIYLFDFIILFDTWQVLDSELRVRG